MEKLCSKCNTKKSLIEYDNAKNTKDGKYSICKTCKRKDYNQWKLNNRDKIKKNEENRNIRRRLNIKEEMFRRVKNRCKRTKTEFSISIEDIYVPKYCPVFGYILESSDKRRPLYNSPSLDRIDPTKGYIKGNVQVISHRANSMKTNATKEEMLLFAKWILGENK